MFTNPFFFVVYNKQPVEKTSVRFIVSYKPSVETACTNSTNWFGSFCVMYKFKITVCMRIDLNDIQFLETVFYFLESKVQLRFRMCGHK